MSLPMLSPLDAAARLAGRRGRVLWHSERDDDGDPCSFVAAEPHATLIARGHSLVVLDATGRPVRRFTDDPLDAAEAFLAEHDCRLEPAGDRVCQPRVVGYLGYNLARVVDRLPGGAALGHDGPDLWLGAYGAVARWSAGELAIVGVDRDACAELGDALARPAPPSLAPAFGALIPDDDAAHHTARIERVRDYLAAGDVARVHLARRLIARLSAPGDALALYAALAEVAPASHGALLETDGTTLVASSPEGFLGSVGDRVALAPIDDAQAAGYAALLRASFPADSITGAPKLRAMEVIDELEPVRRGPYGGVLGYFGAGGAFDLATAIQIGVIAQSELHVHVGGAIVADSDAAAALAETERQAAGWVAALDRLDQLARLRAAPCP
jgi:anthranilate/para-aminobenzoate synthase component I